MRQETHRLWIPNGVGELIRKMHPHLKRKIKVSPRTILLNPNEGKALKDDLAGLRSFPVSKFRIIYRLRKHIIEIVAIGPRDRIYEETFLILKRQNEK